MIELMPVACWKMATPMPAMKMRRIHGTLRSLQPPRCASSSSAARNSTSSISARARSSDRTCMRTESASSWRPFEMSQRGDSGIDIMPTNRAIAGRAATASM